MYNSFMIKSSKILDYGEIPTKTQIIILFKLQMVFYPVTVIPQ
jgi:hypothetical protein